MPQPGDSEVTFAVLDEGCHLVLPVEPLKGRGNPVKGTFKYHMTVI